MRPAVPAIFAAFVFAGCETAVTLPATRGSPHSATPAKASAAPAVCAAPYPEKEIPAVLPDGPLEKQLDAVDLRNGVSATEAVVLATAYFLKYDGLCGGIHSLKREPAAWRAFTLAGPSGVAGEDILVDVFTGAVSAKRRPTIHPPWLEVRDAVKTMNRTRN